MHKLLSKFIQQRSPVTDEELAQILSYFKPFKVAKHQTLVEQGDTARYLYFINKGCLRSFYILDNGTEATRYIAFEGSFCTGLTSFITQKPSMEYVDALEKSELLRIEREEFYQLLDKMPAWERAYRISLEYSYLRNSWRLETLICMDARARYENLLATQPLLVQRLPNKIVASYLGITPESLSRLKGPK